MLPLARCSLLCTQVPRAFGAYDDLLIRLGARRTPTLGDYVSCLGVLAMDCDGRPLNPNEFRHVCQGEREACLYDATLAAGTTGKSAQARQVMTERNLSHTCVFVQES
jgi:hypothetical protein